ncbi:MAG: hypothetical protein ACKVZ0_08460 [Gemmatimonadales bacterium]
MLDWPHLHVALNHLPVFGLPFIGLLLVIGLVRRSRELILTASALAALFGPATLATKFGGEQAEEALESAAWFNEATVEEHEEAADLATIAALLTAVAAAVIWWRQRQLTEVNRYGAIALLVLIGITTLLLANTGLKGGAIRHDEFGQPASAQPREDDDDRGR